MSINSSKELKALLRDKTADLTAEVVVEVGNDKLYTMTLGELLSLTVYGAGRRGGKNVQEKYGEGFFKAIGEKGGKALTAKLGDKKADHFREMGRKGGTSLVEKLGDKSHEFYENIGRKGGNAAFEKHGREHYVEMAAAARDSKADEEATKD